MAPLSGYVSRGKEGASRRAHSWEGMGGQFHGMRKGRAGEVRQEEDPMSDVPSVVETTAPNDPHAAAQLLPLVYDELRRLAAHRLAHEAPGLTLQPTALVHEAYLRLLGNGPEASWDGRGHFFAAAAETMR